MTKYVDGIEFATEECCNCGMPFAVTKYFQQQRSDDKKVFYCPQGHAQRYTGPSEAEKLRRQLSQVVKAHRKMRERVKNGVCPCCNRTFTNLMEHMKTQHPEFNSGQQLRVLRDTFGLTQNALADEIGILPSYVSLYERCRPTPAWAQIDIESWMAQNAD